jgi:alanine racemase
MHRAGCNLSDLASIAVAIEASEYVTLEGVYTHFAESEAIDDSFTRLQLERFKSSVAELAAMNIYPPLVHCANSAAILTLPESHCTMVRSGLLSYGMNPFSPEHPGYGQVKKTFRPVLSLKTEVVSVRTLEAEETVGYNRRWRAEKKSLVALLSVGYGDGYRRTSINAGRVLIKGHLAPIIGSVAMDQMIVDISDVSAPISVGEEVVLLGVQGDCVITAEDMAGAWGTINYEVTTALSDRISREYLDKE